MATLTRGHTFGATESVTNTKLHNLVDLGGVTGITNADCAANLNLSNSKLANIVDAGKVSGSSFYNLASIPSGAGYIPANNIFPIGSIYINVTGTNPGTFLGGTWVAFGAGKCLVGLDSGDTDFDTAEETGGAKAVTLTAAQSGLPSHNHELKTGSGEGGAYPGQGVISYPESRYTENTGGTNASEAHSNVQPYIVVYFFKRTA